MFKFTKKLAIVASLVTLSAGYFDVLASDGSGLTPMELGAPPVQHLALANTDAPADSADRAPAVVPGSALSVGYLVNGDVRKVILTHAAVQKCLHNESLLNLDLVCKDWRAHLKEMLKVDNPCWKARMGIFGHEDIYERFLKGVLIYRPNPGSDEGMIQLKIADLLDPKKGLCGTFNLSQCGDRSKYVVITTDPAVFSNKTDYQNHLMILIAPRFLITQKLNSTAAQFKDIMDGWSEKVAPIGIFWCGGWYENGSDYDVSDYDYLVDADWESISTRNLYGSWQGGGGVRSWAEEAGMWGARDGEVCFRFRF